MGDRKSLRDEGAPIAYSPEPIAQETNLRFRLKSRVLRQKPVRQAGAKPESPVSGPSVRQREQLPREAPPVWEERAAPV